MFCPDERQAVPRDVWLRLTCDGDHPGGCPGRTFRQYGYIAQRQAAMAAGWKITAGGQVYGPCCSGKAPTED
jgi:hypothetical protein